MPSPKEVRANQRKTAAPKKSKPNLGIPARALIGKLGGACSMTRLYVTIAVCLAFTSTVSGAQERKSDHGLLIAAAADLNPALKEIAEQFQKNSGVPVKLSFGASGALTQQIQN